MAPKSVIYSCLFLPAFSLCPTGGRLKWKTGESTLKRTHYTNLTHEHFFLKVELRKGKDQNTAIRLRKQRIRGLGKSRPWDSVAIFHFLRHSQLSIVERAGSLQPDPGSNSPPLHYEQATQFPHL